VLENQFGKTVWALFASTAAGMAVASGGWIYLCHPKEEMLTIRLGLSLLGAFTWMWILSGYASASESRVKAWVVGIASTIGMQILALCLAPATEHTIPFIWMQTLTLAAGMVAMGLTRVSECRKPLIHAALCIAIWWVLYNYGPNYTAHGDRIEWKFVNWNAVFSHERLIFYAVSAIGISLARNCKIEHPLGRWLAIGSYALLWCLTLYRTPTDEDFYMNYGIIPGPYRGYGVLGYLLVEHARIIILVLFSLCTLPTLVVGLIHALRDKMRLINLITWVLVVAYCVIFCVALLRSYEESRYLDYAAKAFLNTEAAVWFLFGFLTTVLAALLYRAL